MTEAEKKMNFESARRVQIVNSAGDIAVSQSELGTDKDVPEHLKNLYCKAMKVGLTVRSRSLQDFFQSIKTPFQNPDGIYD
jgi:hypothetical protein